MHCGIQYLKQCAPCRSSMYSHFVCSNYTYYILWYQQDSPVSMLIETQPMFHVNSLILPYCHMVFLQSNFVLLYLFLFNTFTQSGVCIQDMLLVIIHCQECYALLFNSYIVERLYTVRHINKRCCASSSHLNYVLTSLWVSDLHKEQFCTVDMYFPTSK